MSPDESTAPVPPASVRPAPNVSSKISIPSRVTVNSSIVATSAEADFRIPSERITDKTAIRATDARSVMIWLPPRVFGTRHQFDAIWPTRRSLSDALRLKTPSGGALTHVKFPKSEPDQGVA